MSRQLADKIRVRVLRRHIVRGLKGITSGDGVTDCVVAQALRERFPRRHIEVGFSFAKVEATKYDITAPGMSFIHSAVAGRKVNPTTITLIRYNG